MKGFTEAGAPTSSVGQGVEWDTAWRSGWLATFKGRCFSGIAEGNLSLGPSPARGGKLPAGDRCSVPGQSAKGDTGMGHRSPPRSSSPRVGERPGER